MAIACCTFTCLLHHLTVFGIKLHQQFTWLDHFIINRNGSDATGNAGADWVDVTRSRGSVGFFVRSRSRLDSIAPRLAPDSSDRANQNFL